jgi:cell division protein FtsZ
VLDRSTSMIDAFRSPTTFSGKGVQGICDLITMPGLINLDFADVRTVMSGAGSALMGIGYSEAARPRPRGRERALRSPLIDTEIVGARGILLSIAGGDDLTLLEVNEAAEVVRQAATDDTNIIFGATVDERLNGQVWVTVVATGSVRRAARRSRRRDGDVGLRRRRARDERARARAAELPALNRGRTPRARPRESSIDRPRVRQTQRRRRVLLLGRCLRSRHARSGRSGEPTDG